MSEDTRHGKKNAYWIIFTAILYLILNDYAAVTLMSQIESKKWKIILALSITRETEMIEIESSYIIFLALCSIN